MNKAPDIFLKNASYLDIETEELRRGDILIRHGKIIKIAPGLESGQNTLTVNCSGSFVIPSLFDMHVHLNSSEMLDLFIANGVTGVRNMWGYPLHLEWKKQIEAAALTGPYVFSTGPLTDGVMYWAGSQIVTTEDEAERAVVKNLNDGYLFFKTYPNIPRDAYLKILETAKKHSFPVCGHGSASLSWKTLADFGYYCCEHSNCLPDDPGDIDYMAKSGMWFCPTHVVVKTIADYVYGKAVFSDLPWYDYVPGRVKKEWNDITQWRKTNGRYDLGVPYPLNAIINKARRFIAVAGKEKILLGTDTNNPGVCAGFSIHDELKYMVEIFGLTELEALKTGTVNAAKHLKLENSKGKIQEGFDADILILKKNPLENIENSKSIEGLIQGGKLYSRKDLDAILDKARSVKDEHLIFPEDTPSGNSA